MSVAVEGQARQWRERRLVVRSVRHAEAAEAALRARVAKAKAQVEALNLHGRGRRRFEEIVTLRQEVNEIVQRHRVEDLLWLRYDQHTTTRPVRAYSEYLVERSLGRLKGRPLSLTPMYVQRDDHATGLIGCYRLPCGS